MNDLRLASTIKLYNLPPVEKHRCNPRLTGSEESIIKVIKSLKSGWNCDLL